MRHSLPGKCRRRTCRVTALRVPTERLLQFIRDHRRAAPFRMAAVASEKYLRAWYHEAHFEFVANGERFALERFARWNGGAPTVVCDVGAHEGEWAEEVHALAPSGASPQLRDPGCDRRSARGPGAGGRAVGGRERRAVQSGRRARADLEQGLRHDQRDRPPAGRQVVRRLTAHSHHLSRHDHRRPDRPGRRAVGPAQDRCGRARGRRDRRRTQSSLGA
jgi:hypothetical protein